MGVVTAAPAIALAGPLPGAAAGIAGAALAAAVRALAGDSPASLVAAVLAPLLAVASFAEHHAIAVAPCIAVAAMAWTIVELARTTTSPLVAMLPATIAGVLEPAAIALVLLAGTRLVTAPWQRPKWAIAVPIAGGLAVMLAIIAGGAEHGTFGVLGASWFGAPHAIAARALAAALGEAFGPLAAVAAVAGLALVARLRLAELAVIACAIGALLVDLRAGHPGPTTLAIGSLCAALAIGRFAAIIHLPRIQAVAGATAAAMLLLPPIWTVVERAM